MKNYDGFLIKVKVEAEHQLGLHRTQVRQVMTDPGSFKVRGYDKLGHYQEWTFGTDPDDPQLPKREDWIPVPL